jgi:hypothetical protein
MSVSDADFMPSHDLIFRALYPITKYHWKLVSAITIAWLNADGKFF